MVQLLGKVTGDWIQVRSATGRNELASSQSPHEKRADLFFGKIVGNKTEASLDSSSSKGRTVFQNPSSFAQICVGLAGLGYSRFSLLRASPSSPTVKISQLTGSGIWVNCTAVRTTSSLKGT